MKTDVNSKEAAGVSPPPVRAFRQPAASRRRKAGTRLLKALYLLDERSLPLIYGPQEQRALAELVDFCGPAQTRQTIQNNLSLLADVEVLLSGWHAPVMDQAFLDAAPKLRAVFYGAGSTRYFTTEAFWKRDIVLTSAAAANAIPAAEYTQSVIVLSLKHFWPLSAHTKNGGGWDPTRPMPGCYGSTVGLISLGMVARKTLELLRPFELRRLVSCPFLTEDEARRLEVERCELGELFRRSDVVSLHTPDLPETRGMICGEHFASMKPGATFINTARGAIVREAEMIEVLRSRPDLTAVLDVTDPEPPALDSPLRSLPNVVLTPHIAGSMGTEINRLGRCMVEELRRFIAGEPLQWQITRDAAATLA
jgi:phosphoglycerate dehydrogenase-like enzyme